MLFYVLPFITKVNTVKKTWESPCSLEWMALSSPEFSRQEVGNEELT